MNANELPIDMSASDPNENEDVAPWEEIAAGRFMPRRIRGSLRGRVLG